MTTTKWILCVIAASVTSSYATFHLNQPNQNELSDTSKIENFSTVKSSTINSTEQRHGLVEKTDSARDNCNINLNQATHLHADKGDNNTGQEQLANIESLQLAYEKKQNEIALFRAFTEKTGANSLDVISKNYNTEAIYPAWARSKEDELLAILDSNKTLQNTAPLELSCKSQNCRLILSAHDEDQGESLYSAFKNEALHGSDENKKQVISYFRNPGSDEIHIYLSKSTVSTVLDGNRD